MNVRELKAFLLHHGVCHQNCLEKADLQEKARTLVTDLAAQAGQRGASASAKAATESVPRGKDNAQPVHLSEADAAASAANLCRLYNLFYLSSEELREKLKLLDVDTTDCVTHRDLVDRLTSELRKPDPTDPVPAQGPRYVPDEARFSVAVHFLERTTDEHARAVADKAVEQLLQQKTLPPEVVNEGGIRLMVKGTSSAVRRSGLLILEENIRNGTHQLRRNLADAGVLKAMVRMLHEQDLATRFEVLDTVGLFSRTPSLGPKIWEYGAMASLLEELHRPEVRARLEAGSPEVLVPRGRWACGQSMALRIFANMMMPSRGEREFLPGKVSFATGQPMWDAFTRKVGRWVIRNKVHARAGELLALARAITWRKGEEDDPTGTHTVVVQAARLLTQLTSSQQDPQEPSKICEAPSYVKPKTLLASGVHPRASFDPGPSLMEQWETCLLRVWCTWWSSGSEAECTSAVLLLTNLHRALGGTLARFCTEDEIMRICTALRASRRLPPRPTNTHLARETLLSVLQRDMMTGGSFAGALTEAWCHGLKCARETRAAESVVERLLRPCEISGTAVATDERLYEYAFWPTLARHAAAAPADRRSLLITFAEAFNLHPEPGGIPLEPGVKRLWGIPEPYRARVTLQLLRSGIVRTLERACHVDETAAHVMRFYRYIAEGVEAIAEALLTDPDLMPFLLRFALLETGCPLGVALAKLAVKALLKLSPRERPPNAHFTLVIRPEEDPSRSADSIRYDYKDGCIYVGQAHITQATAVGPNFLITGQKLITKYNRQHTDRPYVSERLRDFDELGGKKQGPPAPPKRAGCAVCAAPVAKAKCSRCRKRVYCGRNCQQTDWPSHKLICRAESS
ncbi:hypothetical protein KFL_001350050 [Klebsormidium nitens]|uniref:MYND-type domain-containing protein n=1 Tax=Klebsormidium nitens TaxID=105231 RepID=A0A1Y1I1M9_KLENI|nr:hypothetical protein KFL_001350050 [Klebsormidium nitens]|eukprot:GAQ83081.1 hypothetical protein KFL_001350050 [Klebsormidium nitens]